MPFTIVTEMAALDDRIIIWLNHFMFRWPLFDGFVVWLLNTNIIKFVPLVLAICWLWFERTTKQVFARQILLESVLTALAALIIARTFALALPFRDRPFVRPDLHFVTSLEPALRSWSSFPSDHAVMAFALAASLFRLSPRIGLWAFFHATVFICLPRLYFGLHYPSDLIGGGLIGITLVLATSQLQARHAITGFLLDIERKHPARFYAIGFFVFYEIAEMFNSFRVLANYTFTALRQFFT